MSIDIKTIAVFLPFIGAALIGFNYACNETAFGKVSLSTYIVAYCAVAVCAAILLHFLTPEKIDFSVFTHKPLARLVTISIIASTVAWVITILTIKNVSANYTAIAELSYPFFTILFGYLIFARPVDWSTALGGVLIVSGSVILITGKLKSGG